MTSSYPANIPCWIEQRTTSRWRTMGITHAGKEKIAHLCFFCPAHKLWNIPRLVAKFFAIIQFKTLFMYYGALRDHTATVINGCPSKPYQHAAKYLRVCTCLSNLKGVNSFHVALLKSPPFLISSLQRRLRVRWQLLRHRFFTV